MPTKTSFYLTEAQLRSELEKCEYCEENPCRDACPCGCSPADFIMAARVGEKADYRRAAALIMGNNPLGGICGLVCPDRHCMSACSRKLFDCAVNIPAVQATIIQRARELGVMPAFAHARPNGRRVAVAGAGPAGLAAAAVLAQKGCKVDVFEASSRKAGMSGLIPPFRLDSKTLRADIEFVKSLGDIRMKYSSPVKNPAALREKYDAVIVAAGLTKVFSPGIKGEAGAVTWLDYLARPAKFKVRGRRVAVIGGGAVAADCAETAVRAGAAHVELFALEKFSEMPLEAKELDGLRHYGVQVGGRVRVTEILRSGRPVRGLRTVKVDLPAGKKFSPRDLKDVKGTAQTRMDIDFVIIAAGARTEHAPKPGDAKNGVFYAGDAVNGPTTVVEAAGAGKNAALEVEAFFENEKLPRIQNRTRSALVLAGRSLLPVPLEADFFGRRIISPFLLSAAPPSDGYEQMKKAYDAGWAGGVMKTAFDGIHIHIPSQYMFAFNKNTYGNCDNVSGHPLDRVCGEIERLRREYPDHLTLASTGGPVTGDDAVDMRGWQANTRKLEAAGVMGIEYSLSCPQGGDGTKGDIVSQDAELTAKIIDWIMQTGDGRVPKLFKLTAAVTAIYPIMDAIRKVLARHPGKPAGVTLANTFPTLAFRKGAKTSWEEGVVVGMSGDGVTPISNLTLANVSKTGVTVSGNGGPMDYKAAANFLALGAGTVQFCTIVMKHGYGIIDDLHSGLSHLLEERGLKSVRDLIGVALPDPVTGFMELSPIKKISAVHKDLCEHCGNCTRCPYLAIELDGRGIPKTEAARCIGCSICTQKCFAGALYMRDRTTAEAEALVEA